MKHAARRVASALILVLLAARAQAQPARGVVVDQTGLPLPGVTIQILDGTTAAASTVTGPDGTFAIDPSVRGDAVVASLDGFEPKRVARTSIERIELELARTTETTTVVGSAVESSVPTTALLGSTLTASTVARLPSAHFNARESLPLLPSVLRGADGLMQLGGARAYETPLTLDGFNVTDPATGLSSVNLPLETVAGIEALRDPMAVTYGGLLGGMVRLESKPGTDTFKTGVQGFIPRPRFSSPGFGRLEGIFPRVHLSGSSADRRLRYIVAAEYDYERIPVPGVTDRGGDDLVEESAVVFTRVDAQITPRQTLMLEAFAFPARTRKSGLSPRRDATAAVDLVSRDVFAGLTHRLVAQTAGVFTIQIGVLTRHAELRPNSTGPAVLSPDGWRSNWFTHVNRTGTRYSASGSWERVFQYRGRSHDVTAIGELSGRQLRGTVEEQPVQIIDGNGLTVRSIEYGAGTRFAARDWPAAIAVRDVWQAFSRVQVDAGVRTDYSRYGGGAPSGRIGTRIGLDAAGLTVLKAGFGRFVGSLPLAVAAFRDYPTRMDRLQDPEQNDVISERRYRPSVGQLYLPRARTFVMGLERQIRAGLDGQVVFTTRTSARLATLRVPDDSGDLSVESDGRGSYREVQLSIRRKWADEQQVFVSYVRAASMAELNDFSTLFQAMDTPVLQSGGRARAASDAPHRVISWGTFNLPRRIVASPVVEWRSGFPYSPLNIRHLYDGAPNSRSFPSFVAVDAVIYKTFTVKRRNADVGIQLFNLTSHRNPRDVFPVTSAPRFGEFANSVGTILRGYMLLKW